MASLKQVIAYHGWGFDASCWHEWQSQFEQQGWNFQAFDRGYWRQPNSPVFDLVVQTKVLIVHSYGLHLCPQEQLQQADLILILNSFIQFHPNSEPLKRRSQKILQQMIDQFILHPQQVLSQFRAKCYHPCDWQETISANFDPDLLLHDLNHLQTAAIEPTSLQTIPKILILQAGQDRIVAAASSAELIAQLSKTDMNLAVNYAVNQVHQNSTINHQTIETAGHALPFTHFDHCWSALLAFLEHEPSYEPG